MLIPNLTFVFDRKKVANKQREASIELKVYANGKAKYISTGIKVYPREWSGGFVNSYRHNWQEINEQLRVIMKKCTEVVTKQAEAGRLDLNALPSLMKEEVISSDTFLAYARERSRHIYKKVSPGTKEHYELWFRFMEEWKGIVYFTDITERNIEKMDDRLRDKGLKKVSRWMYHKTLKTFIIKALREGLIKKNPYDSLDIKRSDNERIVRYLTPSEFHQLETAKMPTECLERVRDLFVFQTYTMMSYSDLANFKAKNCVEIIGQTVYKALRVKTRQEFIVTLLKPCLDILDKYHGKLPIISNVKYNLYLKVVAQNAKIDKPISTHWARHTGATMLLNEGKVPMHIIQHILGHASIRETEKTYAKVLDTSIVNAMVGYQSKL